MKQDSIEQTSNEQKIINHLKDAKLLLEDGTFSGDAHCTEIAEAIGITHDEYHAVEKLMVERGILEASGKHRKILNTA